MACPSRVLDIASRFGRQQDDYQLEGKLQEGRHGLEVYRCSFTC